jgi:hypothetical protein
MRRVLVTGIPGSAGDHRERWTRDSPPRLVRFEVRAECPQ